MSDLVLGARLEADGGKLVGQLSAAEAAARGLEGALQGTGGGAAALNRETVKASVGLERLKRAEEQAAAAGVTLSKEQKQAAIHGRDLGLQAARTGAALESGAGNAKRQSAAYQQLGFQMQDVFQQAALGVNPLVILAQQGGQTASAIALMGSRADGTTSRFVKFATFLSGPWGAALFGAATIVGFLIQGMLEAGDAAEEGEAKAFNFAGGLDVLRLSADDAKAAMDQLANSLRSAIVLQGSFIRGEAAIAKQKADQLQAQIRADTDERAALRARTGGAAATFLPSLFGPSAEDLKRERELTARIDANRSALPSALEASAAGALAVAQRNVEESFDPLLGKIRQVDEEIAKLNARLVNTKNGDDPLSPDNISDADFAQQFGALFQQRKALEQQQRGSRSSGGGSGRRSPGSGVRGQEALKDFGESAAEKINRVLADFDPAPRGIDKALQDIRELDKLIVELGERKPPGFEETIKSADQARKAVQDGLAAPIQDITDRFSDIPSDLAAAGAALADLDAIAARLKEAKPPNLDELLAQIEQARGAVNESLVRPFRDILRDQEAGLELQRLALEGRHEEADQLGLVRDLMRQVGAESREQLATELFKRGVTADMVEAMVKNLALERQQTKKAGRRLEIQQAHLREVDAFRGSIEQFFADVPTRGIKALGDFAKNVQTQASDFFARYLTETLFGGAFRQIEAQLSGAGQVREANEAYVGQIKNVVSSLRQLEGAASDAAVAQGGEIVVRGEKERGEEDPFDFRLKSPKELFGEILGPLLKEVGIDGDLAKDIGEQVGIALEGVVLGQAASSILFGDKGSNTGAAIGGAIGAAVGTAIAGPLGGQIGSAVVGTLGGLVGGAFSKTQFGTASLSGSGDASVSARGKGRAEGATTLGGSVQSALGEIADALGAQLGGFNVSIGTVNDSLRVSTTGRTGKLKKKFSDVQDFGNDEAAARAFAIVDAIGDGAIKGVSVAVQKALQSSEDIQKALKEALAVKEVEDILAGMAEDWVKELRFFEKTAEERLRIGRQYGFDIVALEERNAEERAKLIEDILQSRVGALKSLLEDLQFGDLAEGSLADRRQKLLGEIARTEAAAEKGDEGAAGRLAQLQRDLIDLSRDAFGTAGVEFGADRDQAISSAERIIALEEERVRNAQAELTDRLDTGNAIANEGNDILAEIRAGIDRLNLLSPIALTGVGGQGIETSREVRR